MNLRIKTKKRKIRKTTPFLSVVIPAYNESSRIGATLERCRQYLAFKNYTYEIIVVDDGSADNTFRAAQNSARKLKNIRVIKNKENRGKGYSVRRGMRRASGRIRLFMDADNSVDISHLADFIRWLERGFDIVIGSIQTEEAEVIENNGEHRRLLGRLANLLIRALATPKIKDTQRGFKLFSARAAQKIFSRQTIERFGFDIEILVIGRKNGFQIKEVPVHWNNPSGSTVGLRSYIETLRELFRITFNSLTGKYDA